MYGEIKNKRYTANIFEKNKRKHLNIVLVQSDYLGP